MNEIWSEKYKADKSMRIVLNKSTANHATFFV